MGGNALSCATVRLSKKNFDRMATGCEALLRARYPGRRVKALGSYKSKADFGDCDILVESGPGYDPFEAAKALRAVEVVRNGPVTSVGVVIRPHVPFKDDNTFQVDLISMEPANFDFALSYFGHGDTGNLLGRVAHAMEANLRHDGLYFYFRDGDYLFREIELTKDFRKALVFMGYPPEGLDNGFDTQEQIFSFVASSPFYRPETFLLENRNAASRVRDKKRPMYQAFLKWSQLHLPAAPAARPAPEFFLLRMAEIFPHFQAEYDQAVADLAEQREVAAKFNGAWVSQLTGLQGKELGGLMKRFKESFETPAEMRAFILGHSLLDIEARVRRLQAEAVA